MKTLLIVRDGFIEFEFGRVPLKEIVLDVEGAGLFRGDAVMTHFLHDFNQRDNGGCPPGKCEICNSR